MELARRLLKGDSKIWIIFMLLAAVSVIEGYSAMSTLAYKQEYFWMPIWRHILILMAGMGVMVGLSQVHYLKIGRFLIYLYPFAIGMLILTPILGMEVNGAHRWVFGLQPSEIGKLSVIGLLSWILSREKIEVNQRFWVALISSGVVCLLILPENFSTAGLLLINVYLLMFISRMPFKKMGILAGFGLVLLTLFVVVLLSCSNETLKNQGRLLTWKQRIVEFVDSKGSEESGKEISDISLYDDNYQVTQAKIAIAHGGMLGQFPGHGQQREFLPQAFSDFIYAIIIEEMGFAGGVAVMSLYIFLLVRVAIIARKCKSNYPKYLLLGSGLLIVIQALVNMAVAVDLMPVTGQPLPVISRGGTSAIITCIYFGIILSVSQSLKDEVQIEADGESEGEDLSEHGSAPDEQMERNEEESPVAVIQVQENNPMGQV